MATFRFSRRAETDLLAIVEYTLCTWQGLRFAARLDTVSFRALDVNNSRIDGDASYSMLSYIPGCRKCRVKKS
jgi:hypothetical protein